MDPGFESQQAHLYFLEWKTMPSLYKIFYQIVEHNKGKPFRHLKLMEASEVQLQSTLNELNALHVRTSINILDPNGALYKDESDIPF